MEKLLSLIRLEPLKGGRTQYTIIIGIIVNALVSLGIVHWTPEQVQTINNFLILIGGYFFAEKLSK